jgi:hypothetical protein
MHLLRKIKKKKQISSELDVFLTIGMEVFSSMNEKKKKNYHKSNPDEKIESFPDKFQVEAEKKIDALIAEYEKETKTKDFNSIPQKEPKDTSKLIVEAREHIKKKPDVSYHKTLIKSEDVIDTLKPLNSKEELLEIKKPREITEIKYSKDKDSLNQKSTSPTKKTYISGMKLPRIKIRSKNEMKRLRKKKNKTKQETPYQNSIKKLKNEIKEEEKMNFKNGIKSKKSKKDKIWYSTSEENQNYKTLRLDEQENETKDSKSGMQDYIIDKKEVEKENPLLDEDIKNVLEITDNLLEKLPDEVIDEFVKSKDYELYEKVIKKYKIK